MPRRSKATPSNESEQVIAPILQGRPEFLPISQIRSNPDNPRRHNRHQRRVVERSIRLLGYNAPILIDKSGMIVSGELRFEALKGLGATEVLVVCLEHLSPAQIQAYIIADNQIAELSAWDDPKLARVLKELRETAVDFDIEVTGFEAPEIDFRIQSLDPPEEDEDEIEIAEGTPVSQLGDLWHLGRNRLLCGNATEAAAYVAVLGQDKAAATFADSPYNVPINGHVAGKGHKKHDEFLMASGEMSFDEYRQFLFTSVKHIVDFCVEGATFFACMDWRHVEDLAYAIRTGDCELVNLCVWVKPNAGMGSLYRSQHELVLVFSRKGVRRRNNVQLGKFGRTRTNVWNYAGMNSFARRGQVRGLDLHPTVKPLAMVSDAILDVTARDEIVLDPFCGSGTTIIAAERTGRRGYGIELDPRYVDTAIARWQRMTKQPAVHACGKTFEEMRQERRGGDGVA